MLAESPRRSRRAFIWVATGLAVLVVITCLATAGDIVAGAVAATRYSARFSGLLMAAAVVTRAPLPVAWAMRRTELTLAFVAAHGVHYGTVVLRAGVEPGNKLRTLGLDAVVVVLLGLILLTLVAETARATSLAGRRANAIAVYVAWVALAVASASRARAALASAVVLGVLCVAMLWRIGSSVVRGHVAPEVRS